MNWPKRRLYLSHEGYAELLEKLGQLTDILPDGSANYDRFMSWTVERWGLKLFNEYEIVVED